MKQYKPNRAKEEREYICGFCKNKFKQLVGRSCGQGKKGISSQVKCNKCHNFLKTWNDEKWKSNKPQTIFLCYW